MQYTISEDKTKFSYYFDLFFQYNILDTFSIVKVDATFAMENIKNVTFFIFNNQRVTFQYLPS